MRAIGAIIDGICDYLSPNKVAGRLGHSIQKDSARRMAAVIKNLARLLLALCEVALILNLASCGSEKYSGFELIGRTVSFEIQREHEWGAVGLTFISVMSLAAFVVLAVKRAPFRTVCWMTALDMLFAVGAVGFYKINALHHPPEARGIIYPEYGAYVAAALYIAVFAAALYGRACETALGIGNGVRDYRHREGSFPVAAVPVLAQVLLMLIVVFRVRSSAIEPRVMTQVLLVMDIILLFLTLCRSRYAGSLAVAETIGLFYQGYATAANGRKFGVLFMIAYMAAFALAVWMMFFLNRKTAEAAADMEWMQREKSYAAGRPQNAGQLRPQAPSPTRPQNAAPSPTRLQNEAQSRPAFRSRFCPECGAKLDDDALFCPGCGKKRC